MTDDKRYTISAPTKQLLTDLDSTLTVTILLDGDLNANFTRLKKATNELLDEFSVYAGGGIEICKATEEQQARFAPIVIHENHKGKMVQMEAYPYALVEYRGKQRVVKMLQYKNGLNVEDNINHSIEVLEYQFIEAVRGLVQTKVAKVAFLEGHGELSEYEVYDLSLQLSRYYQVDRGRLGNEVGVLDDYAALIIADPQKPFTEEEKYIIDQYIMQGGCVLWVLNGVQFSSEMLQTGGATPIVALDLNINDLLFRYGVRVHHGLVQDLQCLNMLMDVSLDEQQPNLQPVPWTYAPLLLTSQQSSITHEVELVSAKMASAVDIVGGEDGIEKNILLATSTNSKITSVPAEVDLSFGIYDEQSFQYAYIPVAVSLEGEFPSLYAHLGAPETVKTNASVIKKSVPTRQIVVAAGSTIRNDWQRNQPLPLGFDRNSGIQFGNRDFMVNAVLYLTDDEGWLQLRQKEVELRLLNKQRAQKMRVLAQMVSIVIPLALLLLVGCMVLLVRRIKNIHKS
jgi:ABC-2 type transport system permease protein